MDLFAKFLKIDAKRLVEEQGKDREALVRGSYSLRFLLSSTGPGGRTTYTKPSEIRGRL